MSLRGALIASSKMTQDEGANREHVRIDDGSMRHTLRTPEALKETTRCGLYVEEVSSQSKKTSVAFRTL
jgi:hypothetical protein